MIAIKLNKHTGFTLVELMVIISLLAIFSAMAMPSFSYLINSNKTQTVAQDINGMLQYSRSLAVQNQQTYALVFSQPADKQAANFELQVQRQGVAENPIRVLTVQGIRLTVKGKMPKNIEFLANGTAVGSHEILVCNPQAPDRSLLIQVRLSGSSRVIPAKDSERIKQC